MTLFFLNQDSNKHFNKVEEYKYDVINVYKVKLFQMKEL